MPTVTDLDRALTDAGIPVDGASLIAALTEICSTHRAEPSADGAELTGAEAAVLAGHSGVELDEAAPGRVRSRAAAMTVAMYADALTTAQVATRLKLSTSWVRRLARDRHLYTLPRDRRSGLRFPRWQFDEDGRIPGMADVLGALPLDVHPLEGPNPGDWMHRVNSQEPIRGRRVRCRLSLPRRPLRMLPTSVPV